MIDTHSIHAGWLIDGSGGPIRRNVLLKIENGNISAIRQYEKAENENSQLTDFSSGVLSPPLIDCHVHLAMSGSTDEYIRQHQLTAGCPELESYVEKHVRQLLFHGVLTVRDGGDRDNCIGHLAKAGKFDDVPMTVQTPGKAWHRKGRYGSLIGRCPQKGETLIQAYNRSNSSGRLVKLVNSGLNSLKTFGRKTPPQFTADEIRPLVEQVEARGGRIMVHANGELPVREAVRAGCHSIEHGFFMGRENLELMAEKGCVWVPTACTMKAYAEVLHQAGNFEQATVAARNLEHQLQQLRIARQAGVKVALGTDSGSPGVLHGEAVVEEMKLMAKAGYSLSEIVQSATSTATELLALPDTGTIRVGGRADFLVTNGAPAQLPEQFSHLEHIYLNGRSADITTTTPFFF